MKAKSILIGCFMLLASSMDMSAGDIYYVSPSGSLTNDGSSWSSSYNSIQAALSMAYPGDTVWVAAGTYYPTHYITEDGSFYTPSVDLTDNPHGKSFILKDGVSLFGGFAGTETSAAQRAKSDLNGNGIIEPWEYTNKTILSGDFNNDDDYVLGADGKFDNARLQATTTDNSFHVIWIPLGFTEFPTLDGLTVTGGGVYAGVYTGPHAIHKNAGGICQNGDATSGSDVTIQNCTFTHNYCWTSGGAIQIQCGNGTVIRNCYFYGNKASSQGGAIRNYNAFIEDSWFVCNEAGTQGGAVYNNGKASTFDRCFAASNVTGTMGGGIFTGGPVKNSVLFNNSAQQGGGIYTTGGGDYAGSLVINCTVANNVVTTLDGSNGSGIFNNNAGGAKELERQVINILFWENELSGGVVKNSAFTNGYMFTGDPETCLNNLLINTTPRAIVNPTDFTGVAGNDNAKLDKLLKSDWHLTAGSPLINAGLADAGVTPVSCYGIVRSDATPDIGAAEYAASTNGIKTVKLDKVSVKIENGRLVFGEQVQSVKLVDISGKIISTGQKTQSLSLAGLSKGVYICVLETASNCYSTKIVY